MDNEFNKFGDWEEAWQQAFNDAEQAPSNSVWQGLENSLMDQKLRHYKRKLFLYQWLAAASVMLLGLWAGWWVFFAQPGGATAEIAQTENIQNALPEQSLVRSGEAARQPGTAAFSGDSSRELNIAAAEEAPGTALTESASSGQEAGSVEPIQVATSPKISEGTLQNQDPSFSGGNAGLAIAPANPNSSRQNTPRSGEEQALANGPGNDLHTSGTAAYAALIEDDALLLIDGTDSWEQVLPEISGRKAQFVSLLEGEVDKEIRVVATSFRSPEKKKQLFGNGSLWLGASLASNVFDPNMSNARSYELAWAEQAPGGKGDQVYTANVGNWDEKEQSRPSIDIKVDAGFRLSNRWMLQTSVKYGSYRVNTLTGTFTDQQNQASYPLYYTNFSYDKLQTASANARMASPIEAENSYKFLSIPLSFSYIVVERGLGVAISSGLSSDFFLGGYIDGADNNNFWNLQRYDISAGENSPFRKVHFNALLGAQLFYRAGPSYMITLEPTYKYAISDFHRSSSFFGSRPTQFGVAVGFRYILR